MVATYLPANLCQGGIFNFFIYSQAKVIGFSVSPLLENNFDNPEKVVSQNHLTYSHSANRSNWQCSLVAQVRPDGFKLARLALGFHGFLTFSLTPRRWFIPCCSFIVCQRANNKKTKKTPNRINIYYPADCWTYAVTLPLLIMQTCKIENFAKTIYLKKTTLRQNWQQESQ